MGELHQLCVQEVSQDYRRQLSDNTVTRISQDLDTLLSKLYESNLQVALSDAGSNASSLASEAESSLFAPEQVYKPKRESGREEEACAVCSSGNEKAVPKLLVPHIGTAEASLSSCS
jgi:hypothetical protein